MIIGDILQFQGSRYIIRVVGMSFDKNQDPIVKFKYLSGPLADFVSELPQSDLALITEELYESA